MREIIGKDERIYEGEEVRRTKDALETVARFRLGSETRESKFWKKEDERLCRLCKRESEGIKHVIRDCEKTGERGDKWENKLRGGKKMIASLKRINWIRKMQKEIEDGN